MKEPISSRGEFRSLWLFFLPLLGISFSNYLFYLLEQLFLTRVSQEAMEAALSASYPCQIFQEATIALAMMASICVGQWHGAQESKTIGPGIWQFIWFSFFSMILTVPGSLLYGQWYFQGTEIETIALPYFYLFTGFNFLYPLGAALSCFFIGQGRTHLVLWINLIDQIVKIILAYLFIFGVDSWISPMGVLGGAISNLLAQFFLCVSLGIIFLSKQHRILFNTHKWHWQPAFFWTCIQPGLFRALNRMLNMGSAASIVHLMAAKGGNHLLILSIGGSLTLFLPFIFEAAYQAQTILVSHMIGSKNFSPLLRAARSGLFLVSLPIILIGIPFLGFPSFTFHHLFPGISLDTQSIQTTFLGVWTWFAYFTIAAIPLSYILAFKDTKFYFYVGIAFWITDYTLMYLFIEKINIAANMFWLILALVQMTRTIPIYFWRMTILCNRTQKSIEPHFNNSL